MFKDTYYQSIREYMPQDAQSALDRQVPIIRQQIAADVQSFGEALAQSIDKEVGDALEREQADWSSAIDALKSLVTAIKSAPSADKADALKIALDDYEKKYRGLGENIRNVVKGVVLKAVPAASVLIG